MKTLAGVLSLAQGGTFLFALLLVGLLVFALLALYALWGKDDVTAQLSLNPLAFTLAAKGRAKKRKGRKERSVRQG